MKKQITAAITAALILANLTACSTNTEPINNSGEISDSGNNIFSTDSIGGFETTDPELTRPELSDDVKRLIEEYPCVLEFTDNDGTVLSPNDIIRIQFPYDEFMIAKVTYGSAYMSYGLPVFATTLDNEDWRSDGGGFSDAIDWLIYRSNETEKSFAGHDFFEVKAGDKLENGLVVKSAETVYAAILPEALDEWRSDPYATEYDPFDKTIIEFDGTLTLEGILYKYAYDEDYFAAPNDVFFYPDTTKNEFVPMWQNMPSETALFDSDVAVIHDGLYYLGNLDGYGDLHDVDYDVDEVFGNKNYARVKITLKNICIGSVDRSTQSPQRAEIVDVERID